MEVGLCVGGDPTHPADASSRRIQPTHPADASSRRIQREVITTKNMTSLGARIIQRLAPGARHLTMASLRLRMNLVELAIQGVTPTSPFETLQEIYERNNTLRGEVRRCRFNPLCEPAGQTSTVLAKSVQHPFTTHLSNPAEMYNILLNSTHVGWICAGNAEVALRMLETPTGVRIKLSGREDSGPAQDMLLHELGPSFWTSAPDVKMYIVGIRTGEILREEHCRVTKTLFF